MKRVRCVTKDEIDLVGILFGDKKKEWNIIIPGVDGNIMTNEFIICLGEILSKNNSNLLLAHHRGSFQIISSNSLDPKIPGKTIGSVFEKFDDSIYDIEAWIKFAIDNGAKRINLLAHSHGCNKIIYYLSKEKKYNEYINKVIFISPLDLRTRMNKRRELDSLYEKAEKAKKANDNNSFVCCGFFYKSAESFYDMMENKNIDNFPMMSIANNDFKVFNSIEKDKYIIYGSEESRYIPNIKEKKKYLNDFVKSIKILKGANHIYQGKEKVLAKYILKIVKE